MRIWLLVPLALVVGCSAISREETKAREQTAAEDAAVKRMIVVQGDEIPGHPKLTELGKVEGVCGRPPAYEDDSSSVRPGLKHAAYEKFGDRVDAIVRVDSWF